MKNQTAIVLLLLSALLVGCAAQTTSVEAPPQPTQAPTQTESSPLPTGEPTAEPTQTTVPTPTPIPETEITIDGDPSDWERYDVLITDPQNDHEGGGFDIAAVRAFSNDKFLYVLIETHKPPSDYAQLDLDVSASGRDFIISFGGFGPTGFMGEVTSGEFENIGNIVGSNSAIAEAAEIKIPLSAFEDTSNFDLGVRPMGGECCMPPDWYAIDDIQHISVAQIREIEPATGIVTVPQVCAEDIGPPMPFGTFEPAPLEIEEGYLAEWFISPGEFSMPQEILITPDGEILVYAVRIHTLSKLGLDGEVTRLAEQVYGYQGDIDDAGIVYLHMHPNGSITRVTPQGVQSVIVQSPKIKTACDSGFGFGPDGNLYLAVSRCGEISDLYQITLSGRITKVAEIADLSALRTSPDGRFIAVGYNTVYELSLDDFSLTEIGRIPQGVVSPSGMTFDDQNNLYVSTGDRSTSGDLYRMDLSADQAVFERVAQIPKNGLSGIEWFSGTGEIIGGQLRQGGVLAVSPNGEIREIVPGNGILTPMGIGFSPCGELAVPNDDGGMMTLVDPSGQISWLMDYISFIPPFPFVAFEPDGTLYANEAAPGLFPVRVAELPQGGQLQTLIEADFPCGLARRDDGVLFFAETAAGRIIKVFPDRSSEVFVEGLAFPQALALDIDGNLYAVTGPEGFVPDPTVMPAPQSGDRVIQISPDGEMSDVAYIPGAAGLAVSPQGDLFVTVSKMNWDATQSKLVRISPDGNQTTFATGFEDAIGLAFDLAGNLYVSDEHANGITRIGGFPQGTLTGTVLDEFGEPVEGARVQVLSVDPIVVGQVVYTDENGEFRLPAAPRIYTVNITAEGYQETSLDDIEVVDTQETVVEINMGE
jgi:hypothetical protein